MVKREQKKKYYGIIDNKMNKAANQFCNILQSVKFVSVNLIRNKKKIHLHGEVLLYFLCI